MKISPGSIYLANPKRTPFGKFNGALSNIRPDDLLAEVFRCIRQETSPFFEINKVDDIVIGDSNGSGEDNRNVGRMSALLAQFPVEIPAVTVNRLCGSGAEAIIQASRLIKTQEAHCAIAGGVESMSRAPWVVEKELEMPKEPKLHQTTIGWRLVNPKMPSQWTNSLGLCAEMVAVNLGISRKEQDEWALRSHQFANQAWENNFHKSWSIRIGNLEKDECIRPGSSIEKLSELKSAFSESGPITAGNSSPINDGAVATFVISGKFAHENNIEPIAEIVSSQVVANEPHLFTQAPVAAIKKLLSKNNIKVEDVDIWEINEAFAAMVLTVLRGIPEISQDKVNLNGGAIAIGHPIGASAARVVIDCARALQIRGGGIGVAAACIGVGQGIAVLIKV